MNESQLSLDDLPPDELIEAMADTSPTPVHRDDPPTAWNASVLAALRAPGARKRCLLAFLAEERRGRADLNDYELSVVVESLRTSAGKRRKELQVDGLVESAEIRRPTDTDTPATCWRLTDLGRTFAAWVERQEDE